MIRVDLGALLRPAPRAVVVARHRALEPSPRAAHLEATAVAHDVMCSLVCEPRPPRHRRPGLEVTPNGRPR